MSDFQKWSVLAFRALDDAGRVLMTIEPESTAEGERLDQLKETMRELLKQALLLNGVWSRRQLDERFQFGKLDTDALNVQLGQQQAEPVGWLDGDILILRNDWIDRWDGDSVPVGRSISSQWKPVLFTAPPQRKPLTDEQDRALCEAYCNYASDEYFKARPSLDFPAMRRIFYAGHRKAWIIYKAAHGIQEPKS